MGTEGEWLGKENSQLSALNCSVVRGAIHYDSKHLRKMQGWSEYHEFSFGHGDSKASNKDVK